MNNISRSCLCEEVDSEWYGQYCMCACCYHVDGVCIDHSSGSGCAACEGVVLDCDLTDYDIEDLVEIEVKF